jgi:hypothetical protein
MKANTLKSVNITDLGIERRSANIRLRAEKRIQQLEELVTYAASISDTVSQALFLLLKDTTISKNVKVKTTLSEFLPSKGTATICFQFQDLWYGNSSNPKQRERCEKFEKFAIKNLQLSKCLRLLNKYFYSICGGYAWGKTAGDYPWVILNGRDVRIKEIGDGCDDYFRALLVEVKFDKI